MNLSSHRSRHQDRIGHVRDLFGGKIKVSEGKKGEGARGGEESTGKRGKKGGGE